ncbi:hypothetical protein N7G274_005368 [Stereocaulon virgatum]|uniref:AA1-like domain-containing protein n=1 Tax=Stereocaulon virgatum TaxID=373712 RepID=A0ABR4AAR3_9LECA
MHLFQLLSLASLALAFPHTHFNTKRRSCSGEWNIQNFEAFQLPPGFTPAPSTPAPFNYTHLTFKLVDPTFGGSTECEWFNLNGQGVLADGLSYPCGNNMSYQYFGGSIELQRSGVFCNNATYTLSGGSGLSLECFELYGGQSCETVTQVNVGITFLEQEGPASR